MIEFAGLHRAGEPLLLPNAWDVASALLLQDAGFAAIGTTSLGITAAAGLPDGTGQGLEETLRLVERLAGRLRVPLTVDLEDGYSDRPEDVAALCSQLVDLGAAGVNLEDGRRPAALHADIVGAVVSACPGLFVNARTDVHWLHLGPPEGRHEQVLLRTTAYADAGAHGVFVPGLTDPVAVAEVVGAVPAPLNLLWTDGLDVDAVIGAGVARLSTGGALYRAALTEALDVANRARGGNRQRVPIDYARVQTLLSDSRPLT